MSDRRSFIAWLGSVPLFRGGRITPGTVAIDATPTALFQQPDGRNNLVRITCTGLDAAAARARVTDRHGVLVGTAGLLPATGGAFSGEVWLPLATSADFQIELEVGKTRVAKRRVHVVAPRRWTVYWLSSSYTRLGFTDLQERCLEIHRENLDAALALLPVHPDYRWTPECAWQVLSYLENRAPATGQQLLQAIRDGRMGFEALYANLLTGLLDHETYARIAWPAGLLARERGLGFTSAQVTGVPGQPFTFPTVLAASGIRYLATAVDPERAVPLFAPDEGARDGLAGDWTTYPQLYWWEGPDGSRVLHWRQLWDGGAPRFGFDDGADAMARRLSDWLTSSPVFLSPAYPYDVAMVYGAAGENGTLSERAVEHVEEFNRRFAYPKLVAGRAEDFFRDVESRFGTRLPVRRGDTGLYREDGAASTAAELALFRRAQLALRAAEILALWDDRTEPRDASGADRVRRRAAERRAAWRDLLSFGEHTWGSDVSVSQPESRQTVAQWAYKRRFLESGAAGAFQHVADGLQRIGTNSEAGTGRIAFNASTWPASGVVRVRDGAGKELSHGDTPCPTVDEADGSALVLLRDVPPLGYLRLRERDGRPNPVASDGTALDAQAGGVRVSLDPGSGAIVSLMGPDGKERVNPRVWSGLNQLIRATGGAQSSLWTDWSRDVLRNAPDLVLDRATLVTSVRERLPGIGVRLAVVRRLTGCAALTSTVTLYDELPWIDIENRLTKQPNREKEAIYVAFPFAFTKPTVEVEVPLGRMVVERDQQPGSCRDWYCHTHWVWMHEGADGVLWSAPDTPLFTLGDIFRGQWRRRIEPDGTVFAYAMHNYWHTNFAASQDGDSAMRFRISLLPADGSVDAAEPVRRGWAACDPPYVSERFTNQGAGPLIGADSALFLPDRGTLAVAAKRADDGDGAIVKLLDVTGVARSIGVWPAAYTFTQARRANLVEMTGDAISVGADHRAGLDLPAWGVAAVRLFTPPDSAG